MAGVKRQRATELAEQLLSALDGGQQNWPVSLVTEVFVFGSYARGATDPHDLDIGIEIDRDDDRWLSHFITCLSSGHDPHSIIRRALVGASRSCQFMFDARDRADFPLTLLWRHGDTLACALDRLHAIMIDETAARAPRHGMLPEFEGLDRWIPRTFRECLAAAVETGAISLHRVQLPDIPVSDPEAREHIRDRWAPTSPLHRAGHAALAHFEQRGVDLAHVHLHGRDIKDLDPRYFAGFALRYVNAVPRCLTEFHGVEWIEVVHPTRTGPLHALRILPTQPDLLVDAAWP